MSTRQTQRCHNETEEEHHSHLQNMSTMLLQWIAALGEQLKVQNSILALTTSAPAPPPPPPPPTSIHYYSCTTKIMTIKDFTAGTVFEEMKEKSAKRAYC